ncbi:DUF3726 domain-containing protein [uncultured Roseibium sp.]|uniref:DUF3726 domain-containing protein n=1 Tax=uncultured Roseibium sp. TaxID=1936171 RepID=UPI002627E4F6|nr:DUF3726 domain-containing protein [uncultured Roseibium sp.]
MNRSLNEIEATAKRATRGAGYSWGLAEEASKATRWLSRQGQDGVAALAALLDKGLAQPADHRPCAADEVWRNDGDLCPLATGAFLSDCAQGLRSGPVTMQRVAVPLFILPFAANAASELRCCVRVEMDGQVAMTDGGNLQCPDVLPELAERITVQTSETAPPWRPRGAQMCPDPDSWDRLAVLAHRTYAPATEESRLRGAGAGLSDND